MANTDFIEIYFKAEKWESLFFFGIGVIGIILILISLLKNSGNFYKGLAIPVILISILQIIVGSTVYLRSDKQISDLNALHTNTHLEFQSQETERMTTVMKNFKIYKYIEVGFILVGTFVLLFIPGLNFITGLGLGLLLEGSLMISADIFAEDRGEIYLETIKEGN